MGLRGSPPGRRRIPTKVAALAVSLVIAVAAGEAVVRIAGVAPVVQSLSVDAPDSSFRRSANPVLAFELQPGYRSADPDHRLRYAYINDHGQRDLERSLEKLPGVRRVLLLGDSVVEGHGLASMHDTLSRRLEALLSGAGVEVLNFGVSGYCTRAEAELLRVKGLAFEPDDVIVVFTANDFDNFNREAVDLEFGGRRPLWARAAFRRSQLFRTAAVALDLWGYGIEADPLGSNRRAVGDRNVLDGLGLIRKLADEHGFSVRIAIWPLFLDATIRDPHRAEGSDGLAVERIAEAHGLPTVRLSPAFRADAAARGIDNPRRAYTIGDGLHPSPAGTEVAARALAEELRRDRRLAPPSPIGPDLLRIVDAVRREDATVARVLVNRALSLRAAGRVDAAIDELRHAIDLEPDAAEAHNNLANLLSERGRLDEAIPHYRRALEIEPFETTARANLARALARGGDLAGAATELFRVAEERETDAAAWRRAADAAARAGRFEHAADGYGRALALGLDDDGVRINLANARWIGGDPSAALALYRDVLDREPDRLSALVPAARILATHPDPAMRDPRAARSLLDRAVGVADLDDVDLAEAIAVTFDAIGLHDEAATVRAAGSPTREQAARAANY